MTGVRTNVLANLAGQGWGALLQLLLLPLYIHFLGIEAYGIVSLYVVLMTSVQIFDLGLAQTLNRELARWRGLPQRTDEVRDLIRTIELVYWAIIMVVCAVLLVLASLFTDRVLHPQHLDAGAVTTAVMMMIAVVALQWPVTLYQSGLMGLQQQVRANVLRIALSTLTGGGAILILWLVSPTIVAFFAWQILAAIVAVALTAYVFHAAIPASDHGPRFNAGLLKSVWRFAAGVSGLTISAVVLTQVDKWILVNILSLEAFGFFALAWTVANALNLLTAPVFAAVYPRFSTLVAQEDRPALLGLYHLATQAVSLGVVPLALVLSLFSGEVLLLWTRQEAVAYHSAPILSVLVIGTLLNSLAHLPYAWELAHGRTRVFLTFNWIAIAIAIPGIWYLAARYGGMGAALVWLGLNASYFLVAIPLIHRRLAREERLRWLLKDIALPLAASVAVAGATRAFLPVAATAAQTMAVLTLVLLAAMTGAMGTMPPLRALLGESLLRRRRTGAR